jgi:hypothetical protein
MKKLILAIGIALSLSAMSPSYAADAGKGSVTREDAAAVQKGVEELGQMFGVEKPKPTQHVPVAPAQTKTVADVMDKAVDKISDVVGAMAQAINNVAPDVWRIMLKQQYAKAISEVVVPTVFGIILVVAWLCLRALRVRIKKADPDVTFCKKNEEGKSTDDPTLYGGAAIIMWIIGVIFGFDALWFGNRLADSSLLLINPEFYAIQDLLRMILNKGM